MKAATKEEAAEIACIKNAGNTEKCVIFCGLKVANFLDRNNKLNDKKIPEMAKKSGMTVQKIKSCKAKYAKIANKCEYAFNIVTCMVPK